MELTPGVMVKVIKKERSDFMKKMLIVYYTWSNGNTERIARELQEKTGADIARIETKVPYKGTYDEVVDIAKKEVEKGFMPEIRNVPFDVSQYEYIAIGSPTWWYTVAPAVMTFVNNNDLKGKTVIPFVTHAGWPGHGVQDIKKKSGADIVFDMRVRFDSGGGDRMITPEKEISEWTENIRKFLEK